MPSSAPSRGGWLRVPSSVPLIPISSEYDRLLVQEPLDEIGGGPMDPATDERLLVLDDAKRIAAEGLAERIAARAASPRGVIFGSVACLALMCYAAFRKVESHDASLVSRLSEGMFQRSGGGDSEGNGVDGQWTNGHAFAKRRVDGHAVVQEGHEFPLEHRLAPRAAAMPRDDDGAAQRAVDDAAAGTSERSALRAAVRGARTAPRRKEARLGRQADFSAAWGSWEDEAEANGYGETYGEAYGGGRGGSEDWLAYDSGSSPAEDEEDAFFAVDPDGDAYGAARRTPQRRSRAAARRRRDTDDFADESFLPVVEPTEVAHGATHQAALDELEASIKNSVVEEHERRRKQKRADAESERGARNARGARV